jgi:hypothetical protein
LEIFATNVSQKLNQLLSMEFVNATADMLILTEHVSYLQALIFHAMLELISTNKLRGAFHAQMDV